VRALKICVQCLQYRHQCSSNIHLKALGSLYLKSLSEIGRVVGRGKRENCNVALEISSDGIKKGVEAFNEKPFGQ
jgi:hypothetical protein